MTIRCQPIFHRPTPTFIFTLKASGLILRLDREISRLIPRDRDNIGVYVLDGEKNESAVNWSAVNHHIPYYYITLDKITKRQRVTVGVNCV